MSQFGIEKRAQSRSGERGWAAQVSVGGVRSDLGRDETNGWSRPVAADEDLGKETAAIAVDKTGDSDESRMVRRDGTGVVCSRSWN